MSEPTTKTNTKKVKTLHVKVASPYQTYFDEAALSVSGKNLTGPFDILAGHHNFITMLIACELLIITPTDQKKIRINGGVLHVKADLANIFLDV